ncbi:MAG: NAD(P)-dependent alcohol dehydrogenase [Bacteroidota bacterium]
MTEETMKAMVASAYGDADVLQLQQVHRPQIAADELLVKVMTSAATRADAMMLSGKPYFARLFLGLTKPKSPIPGTGFAGLVEAVGSQVTKFRVGDRVFGETTFGFSANADYLKVAESGVVLPLPENLSFANAANFCDGHLTSFNFLKEIANVQIGQKVLIIGASGALGTSGVQIAKYLGASVHGVCSSKNAGLVLSLGAEKVIDYKTEDYTKPTVQYDFIYDAVGKSSFRSCKPILKDNGVYLSPVLNLSLLLQMMISSIFGGKKAQFAATGVNTDDKLRALLTEVVNIFKEGRLKMVIDRQYPLEKLAEAHRYIMTGRKKGNIVIHHT